MKPKFLKISAWGPFRSEVCVDFRELSMRGLFLITGPTGAGKTTIFDAISFALFGRVSGEIREKDSVRSDFAGPDEKTFVELTFVHRGGEYQVIRNPRYLRPKKRKTGVSDFTVENENALLKLPDGRAVAGSAPVTEQIGRILGYDYRQFKQISMIAQGEFTRLLNATAAEKTRIFREIFDTGLFGRVEKNLRRQSLRLEEQRDRAMEFCSRYISELELPDEEWGRLTDCASMDLEAVFDYLRGAVGEDESLLKEENRNLAQLRTRRKKLEQELAAARELARQREEYERAAAKWEVHQREALKMRELSAELRLAAKAENVRPSQTAYETLSEREGSLRRQEGELAGEILTEQKKEERLREAYERVPEIRAEQERLKTLSDRRAEQQRLSKQRQDTGRRLDEKRERYLAVNGEMKKRRRLYEDADELFRKAAAGVLAQSLRDGEPCPVCGSARHPRPAVLPGGIKPPQEQEVERLRLSYEEARQECEAVYGEIAGLKGEISLLEASGKKLAEELSGQKGSDRTAQELLKLSGEQGELALRVGRDYEEQRLSLEGKRTLLQNLRRQRERVAEEKKQAEKAFAQERKKNGFSSKDAYLAARRDREDAASKAKLLEEYEKEGIRLRESVALLQKKAGRKEKTPLEELYKLSKELDGQERERDTRSGGLKVRLAQEKKLLKALKENREKIGKIEEEYAVVKDLANLTGGQNSLNLVFEQYVLASYFEEILDAANLRMDRMSMGRYELSRAPGVGDGRAKDNLEIQVLDHYTGKYRSVKTLSGGEAFKAALSLALGLSDIIKNNAGGIEVDTLFIDEGFGALDTESLEQAVDCLAGLVENDRFIGIISHVSELRERLDRQIIVEKEKNGSNIRIVS